MKSLFFRTLHFGMILCMGAYLPFTRDALLGQPATSRPENDTETTPATSEKGGFRKGNSSFVAMREMEMKAAPGNVKREVVVTEFYHGGLLNADGSNLRVWPKSGKMPTASKILQYGPGDFCRVAFQTTDDAMIYNVYYGGGESNDPQPDWSAEVGLICEVRRYVSCNPDSAESVRTAFEQSSTIGKIYVPEVFHMGSPIETYRGQCLVRYSGNLQIPQTTPVRFFTASQDASFLYIDGKLVTAAPGVHDPYRTSQAKNGNVVSLTTGSHRFEYDLVATGSDLTAVALWESSPNGDGEAGAKPVHIPPEAFGSQALFFAPAPPVSFGPGRTSLDFSVKVEKSAPCTEAGDRLILVHFGSSSDATEPLWDFGDGQTGKGGLVSHVYLGEGERLVKMVAHGQTVAYTIAIIPPVERDAKETVSYAEWLPQVLDLNLQALPVNDLQIWLDTMFLATNQINAQLEQESVEAQEQAFNAKLEAQAKEEITNTRTGKTQIISPRNKAKRSNRLPIGVNPLANTNDPRVRLLTTIYGRLCEAGVALFAADAVHAPTDTDANAQTMWQKNMEQRVKMARSLGPIIRDRVGDSQMAVVMWDAACGVLKDPQLLAEAHLNLVDLALHDRLDGKMAAGHFAAASKLLGDAPTGPLGTQYWRVRADYEALRGKFDEARQSYRNAEKVLRSTRMDRNTFAKLGSYERSTEAFLQEARPDRAIEVIRQWETEFPLSKLDGAIGFFSAQYWMMRGEYKQTISEARTVAALAPDSAYTDRAIQLAAEALVASKQIPAAIATYQNLVKQYPGSPLVPEVKTAITELQNLPQKAPAKEKSPNSPKTVSTKAAKS